MKKYIAIAAAFVVTFASSAPQAQTEIKISYQPALYWALPFYIAAEKGWYGEVGLKPVFSTFPAGVPQIAASASKSTPGAGLGAGIDNWNTCNAGSLEVTRSLSGSSIEVWPNRKVAAMGHLLVSSRRSSKKVPIPRNSSTATKAFQ